MGAASHGAAQKAPRRGKFEACLRAVETRRVTALPVRRALAAVRHAGATTPRLRSSRKLVPAAVSPRCGRSSSPRTRPHSSDRPTSAAGQIVAASVGAACPAAKGCDGQTVPWPDGAMAKGWAGRSVWGARGSRGMVPAVGRQQTFYGQDARPGWQNTGAGATCQGAPLPCRAATAIPARNPGPADPICRTVP